MAREANLGFHAALLGVTVVIWLGVGFTCMMWGDVASGEVGILINNLSGTHEVIDQQGTYFYNAITSDLVLLDKRERTMEFTQDPHRGDRSGRDHIRVKTVDGSDVDVDVTINYAIITSKAFTLLQDNGPGDSFLHWVRDYGRTIVRYKLGELTTEEFYDSQNRKKKADEGMAELNHLLEERGIQITSVQIQHFEFYKEYQQKIAEKKLADQEVEEEKSKKLAAEEEQKTRVISANKAKDIRIAEVEGEMTKLLVESRGRSAKIKAEADSEYKKAERQATSLLYAAKQKAEGIRAERLAEAQGIKAFKEALSTGEGAMNLVMMEYARKLQGVTFNGSAVQVEPTVERFEHRGAAAARGGQ